MELKSKDFVKLNINLNDRELDIILDCVSQFFIHELYKEVDYDSSDIKLLLDINESIRTFKRARKHGLK